MDYGPLNSDDKLNIIGLKNGDIMVSFLLLKII